MKNCNVSFWENETNIERKLQINGNLFRTYTSESDFQQSMHKGCAVQHNQNQIVEALCCGEAFVDPWWRRQMETVSALLSLCAGIHQSRMESPYQGQWRRALMFSLICAWINSWANNRNALDLRRHRAHYDVTVMVHDLNCLGVDKW